MSENNLLIELKDICLDFGERRIFRNFNFKIYSKDKIVVTGASGIGKSTLFHLLLGLKQAREGKIFFEGKEITSENIDYFRSQISYVDQDVSLGFGRVKEIIDDFFNFKVNQNISLNSNKIEKLLEEFDLNSEILEENINQLSGGERQRLGLVIAFLLDRPILLLDEIDSALDFKLGDKVINKILNLKNQTVILISHGKEWQKQKEIRILNLKKES